MSENLRVIGTMAITDAIRARDGLADAFGGSEFGPEILLGILCGIGVTGILAFSILTYRHIKTKRALQEYFKGQASVGAAARVLGLYQKEVARNALREKIKNDAEFDVLNPDVRDVAGDDNRLNSGK